MSKTFDPMKLVPHIAAVATFALLSIIYFLPAFQGQKLKQGDIVNHAGMSKELKDHRLLFDEQESLWTDAMFGGMPAYQISTKMTGQLLLYVHKVFTLFLPAPASFLFLYLIGFYILLCCMKVNPWLGIIGAIAFAFGTYNMIIIEAGHNSKALAIGYIPPLLGSIILLFRHKTVLLGVGLTALFMGLELCMRHPQITYYFFMALFLIGITEFIVQASQGKIMEFLKRTGLFIVAIGIAVMANSGYLGLTEEYTSYSTRGETELTIQPGGQSNESNATSGLDRDYITQWSYGKGESMSFLIPNAKGGASGIPFQDDFIASNYPETKEGKEAIARLRAMDPELSAALSAEQNRGSRVNSYWGNQPFTSGPVYFGALVIYLFVISFVFVKDHLKWPILVAVVMMVFLSWGKNMMWFTDFFIDFLPGYSKFRAVTIILGVAAVFLPLLGMLAINDLLKHKDLFKERKLPFFILSGVFLLFMLVMIATPGSFLNFISGEEYARMTYYLDTGVMSQLEVDRYLNTVTDYRLGVFRGDAGRSFLFIILGFVVLLLLGLKTIPKAAALPILGLLILGDLWGVDKRFLNNTYFEKNLKKEYLAWEDKDAGKLPIAPAALDEQIYQYETSRNPSLNDSINLISNNYIAALRESGKIKVTPKREDQINAQFAALNYLTHYRVLELTNPFNDSKISYFHKSVGGYHGAKMKRYQELYDFHLGREQMMLKSAFESQNQNTIQTTLQRTPVTNMMNAKYLAYGRQNPPFPNPYALGPCWFVSEVSWAANADEEISQMNGFNPANTAIVDRRFEGVVGDAANMQPSSSDKISLDTYRPNHITYSSHNEAARVAVFSEVYYGEGWVARIDGEEVPHFRTNYILRGLNVPAGDHVVEFSFEPNRYAVGNLLVLIFSAIVIILALTTVGLELRKTLNGKA